MIDARGLLLKAGQRIGAAWIALLVRTLQSLQIATGQASQIVVRRTDLAQELSLTRPIPGFLWGKTTGGAISPRDAGTGEWRSGTVTLYIDKIDDDGNPYSTLGDEDEDSIECWNRSDQEIGNNKDVVMVEISGQAVALVWGC